MFSRFRLLEYLRIWNLEKVCVRSLHGNAPCYEILSTRFKCSYIVYLLYMYIDLKFRAHFSYKFVLYMWQRTQGYRCTHNEHTGTQNNVFWIHSIWISLICIFWMGCFPFVTHMQYVLSPSVHSLFRHLLDNKYRTNLTTRVYTLPTNSRQRVWWNSPMIL